MNKFLFLLLLLFNPIILRFGLIAVVFIFTILVTCAAYVIGLIQMIIDKVSQGEIKK